MQKNRTWTNYFVYVSEVLGIPNHLKRVNAHAIWRELSTSVLDDFLPIPQSFGNKNPKWMFILYVLFK